MFEVSECGARLPIFGLVWCRGSPLEALRDRAHALCRGLAVCPAWGWAEIYLNFPCASAGPACLQFGSRPRAQGCLCPHSPSLA